MEKINLDLDTNLKLSKQFLPPSWIVDEENLYSLLKDQSINFKPGSREYPLLKQLSDNWRQFTTKKIVEPIHKDNFGISYRHNISPLIRRDIESGVIKPFDRYGSWISRTLESSQNDRIINTIHEGTHD